PGPAGRRGPAARGRCCGTQYSGRDRPAARARRSAKARPPSSLPPRRRALPSPAPRPSREVLQETPLRLVGEHRARAFVRVLDDQRDLARPEALTRLEWQRETDEVDGAQLAALRSEEHTSELQSRSDLVCR